MAVAITTLAVFSLLSITATATASSSFSPTSSPPSKDPNMYMAEECQNATYPDTCRTFLMPYASVIKGDARKLALTALIVSHQKAKTLQKFLRNMGKFNGLMKDTWYANGVKDCLQEMQEGVIRLADSINELKKTVSLPQGGVQFQWHMSNVQTWVGAAMTDASTCSDEFSDNNLNHRVKKALGRIMEGVTQITSNTLLFINKCARTT